MNKNSKTGLGVKPSDKKSSDARCLITTLDREKSLDCEESHFPGRRLKFHTCYSPWG